MCIFATRLGAREKDLRDYRGAAHLDYVIGFGFYIACFALTRHSLIATVSEVSVSIS